MYLYIYIHIYMYIYIYIYVYIQHVEASVAALEEYCLWRERLCELEMCDIRCVGCENIHTILCSRILKTF